MVLAGAAIGAGIAATVAGALGSARATTVTTTPWRIANVLESSTGGFRSVEATGPNDAWAVGALYNGTSNPTAPLLAHWNGHAWQTATV